MALSLNELLETVRQLPRRFCRWAGALSLRPLAAGQGDDFKPNAERWIQETGDLLIARRLPGRDTWIAWLWPNVTGYFRSLLLRRLRRTLAVKHSQEQEQVSSRIFLSGIFLSAPRIERVLALNQQARVLTERLLLVLLLCGSIAARPAAGADAVPGTQPILRQLDSSRGICAVVGDREASQAIELARASELTVYVQLDNAGDVVAARRAAESVGLLNRRVYVEQGSADRLHLADNLADLVVLFGDTLGRVPQAEVLRILRPQWSVLNTVRAFNAYNGTLLSQHPLAAGPVAWGLAIDRHGQVLVTLRDGRVICFGSS